MNIAKLFMLFIASIFFCNIQIQAMDRIAANFYQSIASGDREKMSIAASETLAFISRLNPENTQKIPHGWVFYSEPLAKNEQPLQPDEILELVPSGIEFSSETDEHIFNVLATIKLFEYVVQHYEFVFLLPEKFHSFKQSECEKQVVTFRLCCSADLEKMKVPQTKINKIQAMVDSKLQAIIDKRISNL